MEFESFGKVPRLSREIIITEKIDGTNAQIAIDEDGNMQVGSRNRWITPDNDNFGFAAWAYDNKEELLGLGVGRHYGEWWGKGIQRGYGLDEKRFSLFNTSRWTDSPDLPKCCHVVPVLYRGAFDMDEIDSALLWLQLLGSDAAQGFDNPEGIMIYHVAGRVMFKKTLDSDAKPKSLA